MLPTLETLQTKAILNMLQTQALESLEHSVKTEYSLT